MLISKFDLRKSEWLELVFAKRNKEYGAYYIRQHNAEDTVKAMGITFTSITAAFIAGSIIMNNKAIAPPEAPPIVATVLQLTKLKPIEPPKVEQPLQSKPANMQKYTIPVVVDNVITTMPPLKDNVAIGPEDVTIPGGDALVNIPADAGTTTTAGPVASPVDNSIHSTAGVDVMPEPVGGSAAWNKFLQKNLRYPDEAIEKGVAGKVWVSFVVEKDGQLSNIVVDRGIGAGTEEEALRVLKMAKAWKPGLQSGKPVRVKYNLPLSFVLNQ